MKDRNRPDVHIIDTFDTYEPPSEYDFDCNEYIQTKIEEQVQFRLTRVTAHFAMALSVVLMLMCATMGTVLIKQQIDKPINIETRQPN